MTDLFLLQIRSLRNKSFIQLEWAQLLLISHFTFGHIFQDGNFAVCFVVTQNAKIGKNRET
jgi:hypothetical protein